MDSSTATQRPDGEAPTIASQRPNGGIPSRMRHHSPPKTPLELLRVDLLRFLLWTLLRTGVGLYVAQVTPSPQERDSEQRLPIWRRRRFTSGNAVGLVCGPSQLGPSQSASSLSQDAGGPESCPAASAWEGIVWRPITYWSCPRCYVTDASERRESSTKGRNGRQEGCVTTLDMKSLAVAALFVLCLALVACDSESTQTQSLRRLPSRMWSPHLHRPKHPEVSACRPAMRPRRSRPTLPCRALSALNPRQNCPQTTPIGRSCRQGLRRPASATRVYGRVRSMEYRPYPEG